MPIEKLKQALQMLQDTKYFFKEMYIQNEILFFENYINTLEGMSTELYDVMKIVEVFGNKGTE